MAIDNRVLLMLFRGMRVSCKCDYCILESDQPGFVM
jgi:hypothetical protein